MRLCHRLQSLLGIRTAEGGEIPASVPEEERVAVMLSPGGWVPTPEMTSGARVYPFGVHPERRSWRPEVTLTVRAENLLPGSGSTRLPLRLDGQYPRVPVTIGRLPATALVRSVAPSASMEGVDVEIDLTLIVDPDVFTLAALYEQVLGVTADAGADL